MDETASPPNTTNQNSSEVDWTAEIEAEIRRQLAEKASSSNPSQELNSNTEVLSPNIKEEINKLTQDIEKEMVQQKTPAIPSEPKVEQKPSPEPQIEKPKETSEPAKETKPEGEEIKIEIQPEKVKGESKAATEEIKIPLPKAEPPEPEVNEEAGLDPLSASVIHALKSLKEGDQVNDEWKLMKIVKTSFGGNTSLFYELVNDAGANWTLNPEEMKALLREKISAKGAPETKVSLPDLAPPKEEAKPKEPSKEEKPKEVEEEKKPDNPQSSKAQELKLTADQIDFLKKLHSNTRDWNIFTSISAAQWQELVKLYEEGKLSVLGVDAHPLFDFLGKFVYFFFYVWRENFCI